MHAPRMSASILTARSLRWPTYKLSTGILKSTSIGVEEEAVAKKVIGSTEVQNKARVARTVYRKVLGTEYIRELILK
jgi:hypothetical protein